MTTPSWRAPTVAYQSDVYGDAFNNPFNHIPSYGVGNLRLTWRGPEDQWEASAEVMNVTDKLFYLATNDYSASAGIVELRAGTAAHLGVHREAPLGLISARVDVKPGGDGNVAPFHLCCRPSALTPHAGPHR